MPEETDPSLLLEMIYPVNNYDRYWDLTSYTFESQIVFDWLMKDETFRNRSLNKDVIRVGVG